MSLSKRPADNLPGVEVNDRRQVVEPALEPQVGEALGPDMVWVQGNQASLLHGGSVCLLQLMYFEQIGWSWFTATTGFDVLLPPGWWRYAAGFHDPADTVFADAQVSGNTAVAVVFVPGNDCSYLGGQFTVMSGTYVPLVLVTAVKAEEGTKLGFKASIRFPHQCYFFERVASAVSLPSKP